MTILEWEDIYTGKNKNALKFADYIDNKRLSLILFRMNIRHEEIAKDIIILDHITDDQVWEIKKQLNKSK